MHSCSCSIMELQFGVRMSCRTSSHYPEAAQIRAWQSQHPPCHGAAACRGRASGTSRSTACRQLRLAPQQLPAKRASAQSDRQQLCQSQHMGHLTLAFIRHALHLLAPTEMILHEALCFIAWIAGGGTCSTSLCIMLHSVAAYPIELAGADNACPGDDHDLGFRVWGFASCKDPTSAARLTSLRRLPAD